MELKEKNLNSWQSFLSSLAELMLTEKLSNLQTTLHKKDLGKLFYPE